MVSIDHNGLTIEHIHQLLFQNKKVDLSDKCIKNVEDSYHFLKTFSADKVIYGINTGFGPMVQYHIEDEDQQQLQYNLIRSHCSGSGHKIPDRYVRGILLCRLNSLLKGYSGVHPDTVYLLQAFINHEVYPVIYEHGSVGASGDLVQMAHVALALIGEGHVSYDGHIQPTKDIMKTLGITPLRIHLREGLALINGTSAMTGIGLISLIEAKNLLNYVIAGSALIHEIVQAYDDYFSRPLHESKRHKGQKQIAQLIRKAVKGSKLIRKRENHLYHQKAKEDVFSDKVQEYYSIRCVPQILGPVLDTIQVTENILLDEVNSANDNPIIDVKNNNVFHGGNFHGDYVSLEMDKLKIAITKVSMLAERQLNFLLNDKLNNKLPPFVNLGKLGLNFGMQGMQFTATSTVAENQTLSFPNYVHSIPNNNDNQDIVSMGTNSAQITGKVIENTYEVVTVNLIAIIQAVEYLGIQNDLSKFGRILYDDLREIVPAFKQDTATYEIQHTLKQYLKSNFIEIN